VLADVMQVVQTDEDAQGAAYMALALGHSYISLGAFDKAQEQVDSALVLLRERYPAGHPHLYDAHMISMQLEFAQGNFEQGMAVGKQILRHQSDALGRYSPNTLGTAWEAANQLATVGFTDAASELLADHLQGMTSEQMVASQAAIDAVVLLASIPTQEPPQEVIGLLERATPPNTTGLRDEQIEVVQNIAWYLGFRAGHPEVALHALRRLDAEFLDDDPNTHFCRQNRIYQAKALLELGQYEDASELFEQQVELDRSDPRVSEELKEQQKANLQRTKERQQQHETLP
ncbi:MAG: hypothetical protein QF561_04050, partial [Phycisphaerales bacterium]|nr:hypothetical protein [Phycisphaerales bacterium]